MPPGVRQRGSSCAGGLRLERALCPLRHRGCGSGREVARSHAPQTRTVAIIMPFAPRSHVLPPRQTKRLRMTCDDVWWCGKDAGAGLDGHVSLPCVKLCATTSCQIAWLRRGGRPMLTRRPRLRAGRTLVGVVTGASSPSDAVVGGSPVRQKDAPHDVATTALPHWQPRHATAWRRARPRPESVGYGGRGGGRVIAAGG